MKAVRPHVRVSPVIGGNRRVPHVRPSVRGTKMMGAAQRSLSLNWSQTHRALTWVALPVFGPAMTLGRLSVRLVQIRLRDEIAGTRWKIRDDCVDPVSASVR
jgi:hypothetical protein